MRVPPQIPPDDSNVGMCTAELRLAKMIQGQRKERSLMILRIKRGGRSVHIVRGQFRVVPRVAQDTGLLMISWLGCRVTFAA